ncbi:hypothetical protein DEU56DRAFT_765534 [Suillus clintonianus]|uniref:uncharacterized protein n=1 Tax=Suillus clintonianus TaxID=1904413 RepID=UPI001B87EBAB|nr:uncharacterized protein DEU56DRAFT_765534 [Suillus clintonianus]KAG2156095.1 hypothetical protein DEU56DRAFT_765534 [Suillus clintonianus]
MSHFTSHPYHTMPAIHPSRNNHPLPLSPPETDQESLYAQLPPASLVAGAELEQLAHSASGFPERSKIQSRRTSTLSYQNSGVRDNRDRTLSRGSKSLIVVLPPPDFPLDHGQLGNVLSMGPRHRLSQGILMPLFPTMYGQLTAIAREFNFPSTVGLCLYHHITENGITMTPRISDDAWQYLWAHLIESRNGSQQLPIGGRVEFDIDLNKARWFDAWLAGTLRDDTMIVPAPQSHASILHLHGDSKTTFAEEPVANEDRWDNQTTQSNSRPTTVRHVPKKLSLVDRLDSTALQASYKASQATSPPPNRVAHQLSPIPQSAAPQTSKVELRRRVNSWRASAFLDPASMTESYQPVPNATSGAGAIEATDEYPLDGEVEAEAQELLNLADFAWSVTSAGPLSPPLDSPLSSYRLPSVHLDRRMEGSVLLTPVTATSWGPPDDDWLSDVSSIDRLPSPDIGRRMLESAPLTPATATSWGPADDWRSDVSSIDRLPSPDIAHRMLEDASVTPASGAPWHKVWPWFQVRNVSKSYSPWAGMSASSSSWFDVTEAATLPPTTSYSPWTGMPWVQVWPWSELDSAESRASYSPWAIVPAIRTWPWFDIHASQDKERNTSLSPWAGMPWFNVGPWHEVNAAQPRNSVVISLSRPGGLKHEYPSLDIYPAAYPYFDIYPAYAEANSGLSSAGGYPILEIYPAVYPHFNLYPSITCPTISSPEKPATPQPQKSVIVELETSYPLFNLYPPLYPYNLNSIYPAPNVEISSSVLLPSSYPWLTIYPSVYPHVNPYPQASAEVTRPREAKDEIAQPVQVTLQPQYPILDIYPAGYPWSLDKVYPPTKVQDASEIAVRLPSCYPWLDIYPSVYPFVEPYPTLNKTCESPRSRSQTSLKSEFVKVTLDRYYPSFDLYPTAYPHFDLYPALPNIRPGGLQQEESAKIIVDSVSVDLAGTYPYICPYPPAYPHFDLYPRVQKHASSGGEEMTTSKLFASSSRYPFLVIYAPVYPHFDLYPPRAAEPAGREKDGSSNKLFVSSSTYPFLVIYAPVYPHFALYPPRAAEPASREEDTTDDKFFVSAYPFLVVYPSVYPHFDLYPARAAEPTSQEEDMTNSNFSISAYPFLVVYPHVYPHFNLYPSHAAELATREEDMTNVKLFVSSSTYPFLVIYPHVYPHFKLYPTRAAEPVTREESKIPIVTGNSYPHLVIYPPVYPYFDLYPGIPPRIDAPTASGKSFVRMDHGYPVLNIYPTVYPHFDIYPAFNNVAQPLQKVSNTPVRPSSARRHGKTHAELHAEVRHSLARRKLAKTHRQLHAEVFVNGVTWTPSGYVQDLALPDKPHEEPSGGPRRRMPSIHEVMPRLPRSRSVTLSNQQSSNGPSLRERQQHVLHNTPPIPPLRISSPGVPAVSEFPIPISPPASPTSRLSQAVRSFGSSIIQGRHLTSTSDDHNERAKSPTRSMFPSFDRRSSMIPSLPPRDPSDLLGRSRSPVQQGAQSLVLQRARAYEQSTTSSRHHSHSMRGTQLSLPSLPSLLPLPDFSPVNEGVKTDRSSLLKNPTP